MSRRAVGGSIAEMRIVISGASGLIGSQLSAALVARGDERLRLLVDNTILAARRGRAVPVMDDEDPHTGSSFFSSNAGAAGTRSEKAMVRSSMYVDAPPSPVSVKEAMRQ